MTESFPCTKCGACCKSIRASAFTAWLDREDGVCRYLKKDICTIYENRPDVCNVKTLYKKYYRDSYTWPEFIKENQKICEILKSQKFSE